LTGSLRSARERGTVVKVAETSDIEEEVRLVLVWLIILAIAAGADESKRRTIQLTCAGWWLG
jgi:hypothetical protein